ncbi:MAG: sensor histidine kinase [Chloroflexota bacterium]
MITKSTRTTLRLRLTMTITGVLLFGMGLAAALAWQVVEGLYLETQCENLLAQARVTAASLEDMPLPVQAAAPYWQTANVLPGLHARVLAEQGAVVVSLPLENGDAAVQMPVAENNALVPAEALRQRAEIRQAHQGVPATAIRRVAAAGNRRVLYAAAPVYTGGEISGIVYLATPLPAASLPADALLQLGGALLAAVLLAGAAGAWLAHRIARPLEQVVYAAQGVAAGNLNVRVPEESSLQELHSLGLAFNTMTAGLRQSDQAKNAFIADVTHELRTPLTVIKGTIETLEDGAIDDEAGRGPLLAAMQRETDRLIRLVHDLLVLTRADAGALKLNLAPLDLTALVHARRKALAPLADRRQVKLEIAALPGECACILGDADRLAQVLDNLLDNALRYAPPGSAVTIGIHQAGETLQCTVADCGPGIPAEHLPLIFERFYRADPSRNRQTGGAGLGLAIVKALIAAQGGGVQAESAEGRGTAITFWLPAAQNCHIPDS